MAGEDPQHVDWIQTQPCDLCGVKLGVLAHLIHEPAKGQQPHDHWTQPLCVPCEEDRTQYRGFFELRGDGRWPRTREDVYSWEQGRAAHYRWLHQAELERAIPS